MTSLNHIGLTGRGKRINRKDREGHAKDAKKTFVRIVNAIANMTEQFLSPAPAINRQRPTTKDQRPVWALTLRRVMFDVLAIAIQPA